MKYKIFSVISIVSFIILCGQDFADSQKISIHELQSKAYSDTAQKETERRQFPIYTALIPIFAGAAFTVIYLANRRKK
ncbi:TPA: hypothetical protein DCW38_06615 [candidate division WOR-3 bacterium]|jgi:hypothetical protein|uniref:Uncharacterized protein n=1 Tax=candidate division WOR-3 bacterium TaxID=2052148 RepID=A0A350HBC0_UNCW3|nr:hypothetical protein [candidate division WOR-3 bacterium]